MHSIVHAIVVAFTSGRPSLHQTVAAPDRPSLQHAVPATGGVVRTKISTARMGITDDAEKWITENLGPITSKRGSAPPHLGLA